MNIRSAVLTIVVVLCPAWAQEKGMSDAPFGAGLYQVMEKAACRSCHNADGVASATRLQFPEPEATPDRIEALDMGRRSLHDEGSNILMERLARKVRLDFDTARRLFTLICVLHWKG